MKSLLIRLQHLICVVFKLIHEISIYIAVILYSRKIRKKNIIDLTVDMKWNIITSILHAYLKFVIMDNNDILLMRMLIRCLTWHLFYLFFDKKK